MSVRRKSDPAKLALAARLRRETILSVKAIAERLHLGSPKSARARLRELQQAERTRQSESNLETENDAYENVVLL